MSNTTVTPRDALSRLLAAAKQINADECTDERVFHALQGEIGVAEGVLRDYVEPSKPTEISRQLRAQSKQPFDPEGFALLEKAAEEIERYYGGMMAWKQTAETKDRKLGEEIAGRVNDRIASRVAAQSAVAAASDVRKGYELAAKAVHDRAQGWHSKGNYTRRDECLQVEAMLNDMKPVAVPLHEADNAAAAQQVMSDDDIEWIVNDMGELGVRVLGRCYFCYKGESLVYETGLHDDGEPILHRNVGKREFGEVVYPAAWQAAGRCQDRYTLELVYTSGLSFGPPDDPKHKWLPLPTSQKPASTSSAPSIAAPTEVERDAARYRWLRVHAGIKPTTSETVVSDPLAWTDAAVDSMMKGGA